MQKCNIKVKGQGILRRGRTLVCQIQWYFIEDHIFALSLEMETDTEVCWVGRGRGAAEMEEGGESVVNYQRKTEMKSKWKEERHEGKTTE